jgi:hypothetical protein
MPVFISSGIPLFGMLLLKIKKIFQKKFCKGEIFRIFILWLETGKISSYFLRDDGEG